MNESVFSWLEGEDVSVSPHTWAELRRRKRLPPFSDDLERVKAQRCGVCGKPSLCACACCGEVLCGEHAYLLVLWDRDVLVGICGGCRSRIAEGFEDAEGRPFAS